MTGGPEQWVTVLLPLLGGRGTEDSVGAEKSDGSAPGCWGKPSQLLHRD
jgi:hypothetical protein